MKKLLQILTLTSLLLVSQASWAQGHGHYYRGPNPYGWVAPLVIGGAVGYAIAARPQTVIIQQPPPNIYYPMAPMGYHQVQIFDGNCQCYRVVLVPNY